MRFQYQMLGCLMNDVKCSCQMTRSPTDPMLHQVPLYIRKSVLFLVPKNKPYWEEAYREKLRYRDCIGLAVGSGVLRPTVCAGNPVRFGSKFPEAARGAA